MSLELFFEKKYNECAKIFEKRLDDEENETSHFLNMFLCRFMQAIGLNDVADVLSLLGTIKTMFRYTSEFYEDELTFVENCIESYISNDVEAYTKHCEEYNTNVQSLDHFSATVLLEIKKIMMSNIEK